MGTFLGHLLPGSFFLGISLWWMLKSFQRYFHSLQKNSPAFRSTMTYPCSCCFGCLRTFEFEGFTKIALCVVGITGEIITAFHDGHFAYLGNGQHATMFFFFALSGLVDVLVHYRVPLPTGIEYMASILAFTVEAVLFNFHLHGRSSLDVVIHKLLLYTIYAAIIALFVEMKFRSQPLAALFRAYCVVVQGTWFIQVGYILYNPLPGAEPWDQEDHDNILLGTMIFAWHMAGAFMFLLLLGLLLGCRHRCRYGDFYSPSKYDPMQMQLLSKDANGQTIVNLNDDLSESETEFERMINSRTKWPW